MPRIDQVKSHIVPQLQGLHLFHFDGATCAQRVRFVLGEKGLARGREVKFDDCGPDASKGQENHWVSRVISLVKKDNMTQVYAEIHPNMVVPALVHDGQLYLESMDIIEYLDQAFGGSQFVPIEPSLRESTMALVEQAKELHTSIRYTTFYWGLGRLAMLNKKEREKLVELAAQGPDGEDLVHFYNGYSTRTIPYSVYENHLLKLHDAFNELDTLLQDGRAFVMGDNITIADVFWSMKLLRLLETGYRFADYHPAVYEWFQRMYQRPAFQNEVMGKNRLGHRIWRTKAAIERLFGAGMDKALKRALANR